MNAKLTIFTFYLLPLTFYLLVSWSIMIRARSLLYFHGNGSNNGDLTELAAIFHQLEVSVLLIDYRGYGKSSPIFPNEVRVYEDAVAAWQYLTHTKSDLQNTLINKSLKVA